MQTQEPENEAASLQSQETENEAATLQTEEPENDAATLQSQEPENEAATLQTQEPEKESNVELEEPVYTKVLPVNRDLMDFLDSQDLADFSDVNFAEMSAIAYYTPMQPFQFQQLPYMHLCPSYMENMNYTPQYPQHITYMPPFHPPMPPQPLIQQHPQPTNSTPRSAPKMLEDPNPGQKSTNCRVFIDQTR